MDTKINTTGEKVEARPVAWRWKGHDGKWVYEEGNQTKREMREYDGIVVEDLYSSETVAALVAERDEARTRRDEHFARAQSLIKDVERAKAHTSAMQKNVAEEIGRIRAADKTVEQRRRAEAAEFALAIANARVERLETAATILLSEIDAPGGHEEILMATSSLRAALTGGNE